MSDPIFAPQREGFNCADPDFTMPIPGSITHWPTTRGPENKQPVGLLADPWDKPAAHSSSCRRNTLPPIQVFRGDNPRPSFY